MKIMVCGSIGYGGIDDIRRTYLFLRNEGFDIVNHILSKCMDYSHIKDFRNKKALSHRIVKHDLELINKTDVIVVLFNRPSYGTGIEAYIAKNLGKPVLLFAKSAVPTPWPIQFSDYIVKNEDELIKVLYELKKSC
ncbi:MAG TPA: hypothetical protein VEH06_07280 [Candidatus Bathyarchaeia archaeon]|nr:hypothetical protein [Candidatus Bathyarchaeia archaeon]